MESLQTAAFWLGLFKIVWINIILSGDNAVVIALAARTLPAPQQKKAVFWGSGAAVVLRIALTVVAARLLGLAYLQIVGGCLLLWIGLQLLRDEEAEGEDSAARSHSHLLGAIRTILIADLVMSLDNVIGVAAAAQGDLLLLALGLAVSIPLVIFGSSFMIRLMARFPMIVVLGAGLIGWVAARPSPATWRCTTSAQATPHCTTSPPRWAQPWWWAWAGSGKAAPRRLPAT